MRVGWYNADNGEITVTIKVQSGAASGIKYWQDTELSTKPEENGNSGERMIQLKLSTEGKTTIIAVEVDEDGNESEEYASETIKIDKTKPSMKVTQKVGENAESEEVPKETQGWYNKDVEVTVEVTDEGSGEDGYEYSINQGGVNTIAGESWTKKKLHDKILFNKEGENSVAIRGLDVAGNTSSTETVIVRLDKKEPVFQDELTITEIDTTSFKVKGTATDEWSGSVLHNGEITYTCEVKKIGAENVNETVGEVTPAESKDGSFSITGLTPNGQLNAPEITIRAVSGKTNTTNTGWFNKADGEITITIKDTTDATISGATGIDYRIYSNGVEKQHNTGTGRELSFQYSGEDGENLSITAYLTGNDKNGVQTGTPNIVPFKRDIQPPTTPSLTVGECKETTISVTAGSSDAVSGIASYTYSYHASGVNTWTTPEDAIHTVNNIQTDNYTYQNLTDNTAYNFQVMVADRAGNISNNNGETTANTVEKAYVPNADTDKGTYVNYQPTPGGSYTVQAVYAQSDDDGSTSGNDQYFTAEPLKWKIWDVDTNYVYLISECDTEKSLRLMGLQGYNNGVKILNDLCCACYGNSSYPGLIARSLNIEDIERFMVGTLSELQSLYGTCPEKFRLVKL